MYLARSPGARISRKAVVADGVEAQYPRRHRRHARNQVAADDIRQAQAFSRFTGPGASRPTVQGERLRRDIDHELPTLWRPR